MIDNFINELTKYELILIMNIKIIHIKIEKQYCLSVLIILYQSYYQQAGTGYSNVQCIKLYNSIGITVYLKIHFKVFTLQVIIYKFNLNNAVHKYK